MAAALVAVGVLSGGDEADGRSPRTRSACWTQRRSAIRDPGRWWARPVGRRCRVGLGRQHARRHVSRVDAGPVQVATIDVGGEPAGATGEGFAWVTDATEGAVDQIDPSANRIVGSLEVGNGPRGVAVAFGAVWVLAVDGEVVRVDLGNGEVTGGFLGSRPTAIAAGRLAVDNGRGGGAVVRRARLGQGVGGDRGRQRPGSVAFGAGAVWVANRIDGTVSRIDPETGRSPAPSRSAPARARSPSARARSGWRTRARAQCHGSHRIRRTSRRQSTWAAAPAASRPRAGRLGLVLASTESHRGGALVAAMSAGDLFCDCVDPASYDIGNSTVASLAYDGLTAYRRVGGAAGSTLVANLATEIPEPEDDGLTYVFELRPDLRFSDGTEVDPEDFRSSIERMLPDKRADVVRRLLPLPGHSRRPRLQRPVARLRSLGRNRGRPRGAHDHGPPDRAGCRLPTASGAHRGQRPAVGEPHALRQAGDAARYRAVPGRELRSRQWPDRAGPKRGVRRSADADRMVRRRDRVQGRLRPRGPAREVLDGEM